MRYTEEDLSIIDIEREEEKKREEKKREK